MNQFLGGRYRINDGYQHPEPISLWPRDHLLAMPAPIDVEQGPHRLPSCGDQVLKAVAAHGPVAVAGRDVARARRDTPAVLIEPEGTATSLGYAVGGGGNEGLRAFAAWLTSTHTRRQSVCADALARSSARNSFCTRPGRIAR